MSDDEIDSDAELELVDEPPAKRPRLAASASAKPLVGVCISISGIQNPRRGKLREMALRMGGTYAATWGAATTTTHLICAFAGTPKFNEVSAAGKGDTIVKPEWLEECDRRGRRLDESEFLLQSARGSDRLQRRGSDADASAATAPAAAAAATAALPQAAPTAAAVSISNATVSNVTAAAAPAALKPLTVVLPPAALAPDPSADEPVDSGDETEDIGGEDEDQSLGMPSPPGNGTAAAAEEEEVDESMLAFDDSDGDEDDEPVRRPASPDDDGGSLPHNLNGDAAAGARTGETTDDESGWASDSTDVMQESELVRLGSAATQRAQVEPVVEPRWSCDSHTHPPTST